MTLTIPTVFPTDLDPQRIAEIQSKFKQAYNQSPQFGIRAPGRINLIGEHIDYSGFGVLPMAINKDIIMLMSYEYHPSELNIHFTNTNPQYPPFSISNNFEINQNELNWSNYVKAGIRGLFDHVGVPYGTVHVLVDSNLPSGAGLSSSSALVISSIFFACRVWHLYSKHSNCEFYLPDVYKLIEYAIQSETLVGVKSGGMDQMISTLGQKNHACYIEFSPQLKSTPIQLKFLSRDQNENDQILFVVAHSNVRADKHTTAPMHYNKRVVECKVASDLLGTSNLHEYYQKHPDINKCLTDINIFCKTGFTTTQMLALLNLTPMQFKMKFHNDFEIQGDELHLYKRALHVFTEADRVLQAQSCATVAEMGELMRKSQESCKDNFECSCPEIDQLIQLAMSSGYSQGSRLTGAGWGGCTLHMVKKGDLSGFMNAIRPFYEGFEMDELVFVVEPSMGACYIDLQ
eukprot:NODE_237_length_11991_cov_1.642899.p3 type:complete len:459 gc:universal NODE_237_length_11991_cov_1.642899:4840-6216(+)